MKAMVLGILASVTVAEAATYQGLLFTGASLRQDFTLEEGQQEGCTSESTATAVFQKCAVKGARITVGQETYNLNKVVTVQYTGALPFHYYRGERLLRIGDREVAQGVSVTVRRDSKDTKHISGVIDLVDLQVQSAFEAYSR